MKRWIVPAVVIAALAVLAVRLRDSDRLPDSPEAALAAYFDAAGRGDDAEYLRW